jgi:hypothetical protein
MCYHGRTMTPEPGTARFRTLTVELKPGVNGSLGVGCGIASQIGLRKVRGLSRFLPTQTGTVLDPLVYFAF